jgi:hypothetical protein
MCDLEEMVLLRLPLYAWMEKLSGKRRFGFRLETRIGKGRMMEGLG